MVATPTQTARAREGRRRTIDQAPALVALALALTAASTRAQDAANPADVEFFEREVRPILAARCQKCHGPQTQKGGLRLDSRTSALEGGSTGPAVVPGKPKESLLVDAINYGETYQMPPKSKLPEKDITSLTRWIERGAPWPAEHGPKPAGGPEAFDLKARAKHWSFQPLRAPAAPAVRGTTWALTASDRFILSRLEGQGLRPAPDTDKRTWLRRVTFDLTGLPPTREEQAKFLADRSPQAWATVVDRLLASPHFGERWGRHWLDLVRYAETRGHEFDFTVPNAREYRDYVVRALNADVPFDQFVVEHVAGDLLSPPRRHPVDGFNESVLGTGFWFLGEQLHSPVDVRQDEADRFDNMIDVMSKTFLGLTVACARCHDHKFDAISTKDYYALAGFLQSSSFRLARFDTAEQHRQIAADLASLRARYRGPLQRDLARELREAIATLGDHQLNETLAAYARHSPLPAMTALPPGFEVVLDFGRLGAAEWMPDDVAFGVGPERAGDPIFSEDPRRPFVGMAVTAAARYDRVWDRMRTTPGAQLDPGRLDGLVRAGRTLRTPTFTVKPGIVYYLVQGKGQAYAAVDSHIMINGPLHAQLVLPIDAGDGFRWVAHDLGPYAGHRAHIEFTAAAGADFAIAQIVQGNGDPGSGAVATGIGDSRAGEGARAGRTLIARVAEALERDSLADSPDLLTLADWLIRHPEAFGRDHGWWAGSTAAREFSTMQTGLLAAIRPESRLAGAMIDGSAEDEHVFIRGSHKALGPVVPRRFLEALAGPSGIAVSHGSGRLELARQMTDPALDPFVPRVLVNRIWHHLFGRGIVASVDNFGVLGEPPSHPELLDSLAIGFVNDGWSVKRLIRSLVLSRAYRMSSRPDPESDRADPQDVLLHRMRLRRLEGEVIRDSMLALSGRLDRTMFGPSVPVFLTPFMEGRGRPQGGPLDGDGRRSLYTAVRRNFLSPLLLAFDTPIPFSTVGRRTVSNVPAQALILMNDPFVHQQAERWAIHELGVPASPGERIARMYESAFARLPTESETSACLEFVARQAKLSGVSAEGPIAWTDLAHMLLNVKEFIFLQ